MNDKGTKVFRWIVFILIMIPMLSVLIPFLGSTLFLAKNTGDWFLFTDNLIIPFFCLFFVIVAIAFRPKILTKEIGSENKGFLSKKSEKIITGIISTIVLLVGVIIIWHSMSNKSQLTFLASGIVVTIGGLIMFIYYFLQGKEISQKLSVMFVFELISLVTISVSIIAYMNIEEKNLAVLIIPIAMILPFMVMGIRIGMQKDENDYKEAYIAQEKENLGYGGIAAVSIFFIYIALFMASILIIYGKDIWFLITGAIIGLISFVAIFFKIAFYIKYMKYKKEKKD